MSTMAAGNHLNIVCRLYYINPDYHQIQAAIFEKKKKKTINMKVLHQSHSVQYLCHFILFQGLCTVLWDGYQEVFLSL